MALGAAFTALFERSGGSTNNELTIVEFVDGIVSSPSNVLDDRLGGGALRGAAILVNVIVDTSIENTDAEGHVLVKLPGERVEVVIAVLLESDLSAFLKEACLNRSDVSVLFSLVFVSEELSLHSERFCGVDSVVRTGTIGIFIDFLGSSLALAHLLANTEFTGVGGRVETISIGFHDVDTSALRSSARLVGAP